MPDTFKATKTRMVRPPLTPEQIQALYDSAGPDTTGETQVETDARMAGGILAPGGTDPRDIVAALRTRRPGERGSQKAPVKVQIALRVSADTLARFKATGPGWQTRMDEWLAKAPV